MQKTRFGVTNQNYSNTSIYTSNFQCINLSNHVESMQKVQLQTNVTRILALPISRVFIFAEVFISPHNFKVLSRVLSFTCRVSLEHSLQGRSSGQEPHQLLFVWDLHFSLTFEGQCCQTQDPWLTILNTSACLWPPTFLRRNLLTISSRIPRMQ